MFTFIARESATVLKLIQYYEQEHQNAFEMRALYQQIVKAREEERIKFSRELHDGVLQDLCSISRDLKAMKKNPLINYDIDNNLIDLSGRTVNLLRDFCYDLRPPFLEQDLRSALKDLVDDLNARYPVFIHLSISYLNDDLKLSDELSLTIYRITQEALQNGINHANANEIAVQFTEYPDTLRLTITDDGQGFNASGKAGNYLQEGHYGIAGMRERARMLGGQLDIQTSPGYGTVVSFEYPQ